MVQLYDTYTTASFSALIEETDMTKYGGIVPFETAHDVVFPLFYLPLRGKYHSLLTDAEKRA